VPRRRCGIHTVSSPYASADLHLVWYRRSFDECSVAHAQQRGPYPELLSVNILLLSLFNVVLTGRQRKK
jgi:hypothetical protein